MAIIIASRELQLNSPTRSMQQKGLKPAMALLGEKKQKNSKKKPNRKSSWKVPFFVSLALGVSFFGIIMTCAIPSIVDFIIVKVS